MCVCSYEADYKSYDRNQRWGGVYHSVTEQEQGDLEHIQAEMFKLYNSKHITHNFFITFSLIL